MRLFFPVPPPPFLPFFSPSYPSSPYCLPTAHTVSARTTMMGDVGAFARRAYEAVRGSAAPPPLFSSTVLVVIAATYMMSPLVSASALCLRPADLIGHLQLHRLNRPPLVRANLLHLAINAVAWLSLAPAMEEASGTGAFAHLVFSLLVPLVGLGAAAAAYAVDAVVGIHTVGGCSVGLSGVLFGMLVIHIRCTGVTSVDVCGCFVMPARWYPLALAALIQLAAMGRVALIAHLAGIAVGGATVAGAWAWITPPPSMVASVEGGRPCGCVPPLSNLPGYVSCAASLSGAVLPTVGGGGSSVGEGNTPLHRAWATVSGWVGLGGRAARGGGQTTGEAPPPPPPTATAGGVVGAGGAASKPVSLPPPLAAAVGAATNGRQSASPSNSYGSVTTATTTTTMTTAGGDDNEGGGGGEGLPLAATTAGGGGGAMAVARAGRGARRRATDEEVRQDRGERRPFPSWHQVTTGGCPCSHDLQTPTPTIGTQT